MSSIGAETGIAGLVYTSDRFANLVLQTGGTVPALTISNTQLVTCNGTGGINFPSGNTAQRPANPVNGTVRYNTDIQTIECYINSAWISVAPTSYPIYYLVVGGGGGGGGTYGGNYPGGGGGAGGFLTGSITATGTVTYNVIVGAGGVAGTNAASAGLATNGDNSVFGSLTAIGGGAGASTWATNGAGSNGGSGGGSRGTSTAGTGTAGQGNNGGIGSTTSPGYGGGGGGGAGAVGGTGSGSAGGNGGAGLASNITGSSLNYAGGGGGGTLSGSGGGGGSSVGGFGTASGTANAGTANTGSGGGGGGNNSNGGAGASGVVILSIANVSYTGNVTGSPTITYSSGNTIVKFTSSGTYTA